MYEEGEIHEDSPEPNPPEENPPEAGQTIFREKKSTHKKTILVHDGYEYGFDKLSRSDPTIEFYRCLYRGVGGQEYCGGRIHVVAAWHYDGFGRYKMGRIVNGDHRHIRDAQMTLQTHAVAPNPIPARQAVADARSRIPLDLRTQQGTSSSTMARTYRNYVARGTVERGDNLLGLADISQIVIPDHLQNSLILDRVVDERRMFVFASPFARDILAQYGQHAAVYGTFKCSPAHFLQVYSISVLIDKVAVPCVYGILQSKSENSYTNMMQAVREAVPNRQPQTFMSDFEASALNSLANVFPNASRVGCLFHFSQSVYRKLQRLPALHTQFLENPEQHTKIKCFFALAFVPAGAPLCNYFCLLVHQFPQNQEIEQLVHYFLITWISCRVVVNLQPIDEFDENAEYGAYGFVDQYIRNWIQQSANQNRDALFPMELWNILEADLCRTNNSVEAWHRNLNALFRSHSPRLSIFLRQIAEEENHWRLQVEEFENNPANGIRGKGMKRKQVYVDQDMNLNGVYATRHNRQPLQYLRAISYRMAEPL